MLKTLTTCPGMWCIASDDDNNLAALSRSQRYINGAKPRRIVLGAIEQAPLWEDDDIADACSSCNVEFGLFHRKHHCRACGDVVCGTCASGFETIRKFDITTPVRICHSCFASVVRENEFFERHLPLLRDGDMFTKYGFLLDRCVKLRLVDNSLQYQTVDLNSQQYSGETKIILLETVASVEAAGSVTMTIKTPAQNHKLDAPTQAARDAWVSAIQAAVDLLQYLTATENAKQAKSLAQEHAEMNRVIQGMESVEMRRLEMQHQRLQKNSSRRDELRAKYGLPVATAT
ncbi:hypothetical protein SDRG_16821 [Saprolegnia diclina VS20]|uniref:FYVE-type domain-containing protein n=1 Tax=Saprolegnia diclina (strain VS20) TaxID=1156394 RepID=T0QZZ1_SAPDV|nr:hypothetical protein SDRG_16821 [Saprolegnia diclina VS20]EQC25298.1 hypothetical protein SDRG_16821 [Saprolegnia diclina VS20]|eukprot:XP_008621264.1 hypothetical protein SDRG_16821 [Saprolegnia diclina VS20]